MVNNCKVRSQCFCINKQESYVDKVKCYKLLHLSIVRTRFVTTHNNVGFARKKAQIISFIERGFEKLGLGHQTVVSCGVHTKLNRVRFEESFS